MTERIREMVFEVSIGSDEDVISARRLVRRHASEAGFDLLDQTRIVTAVSELARNIVVHAGEGKVFLYKIKEEGKEGLMVIFEDMGPGIPDMEKAMKEGYSSVNSMGMGLKGAKRLVDDFRISSSSGSGTKVSITKWLQ